MAVTMDEVRSHVSQDEPDYEQAARLGEEALPYLMQIVAEGEPALATKAAYLAAFIGTPGAADVINAAAQSADSTIRVAAAGALTHLADVPTSVAIALLNDPEPSVRVWVLRALEVHRPLGFATQVSAISSADLDQSVRELAARILTELPENT